MATTQLATKRQKLTHDTWTGSYGHDIYSEAFNWREHASFQNMAEERTTIERGQHGTERMPGLNGITYGFPQRLVTTMRYSDRIAITSTSGGVGAYVFSMNGLYDPDITSTGHQPMYFDTYGAIYESYRVISSELTATFCASIDASGTNIASTNGPWYVGINGAANAASISTDYRARAEQNDSVYTVLGPRTGGGGMQTLKWTYSPDGKTGRPAGDDVLGATFGNNPLEQYYAQVWCSDTNSPASSQITVVIDIKYTVELFGLLPQTVS